MGPIGIFWLGIIAVTLRSANCETKITENERGARLPELLSELDLESLEATEDDIDNLSKVVKRLAPSEENGEYQVYQVFFGNEELLKEWLKGADKGQPGVDFPMLTSIPPTKFNCKQHKDGYYGDTETNCQVFHICDNGRKTSFLCPNGTIFQQSQLICDWWFKVDCSKSAELYEQSAEQLAKDERKRADKKRMNSEFHRFGNDNTDNNNNQYPQQNSGGKQGVTRDNNDNNNYSQVSRNQLPGTEQREYNKNNYNNNNQQQQQQTNKRLNNKQQLNKIYEQRGNNKYSSQQQQEQQQNNDNNDNNDNYHSTTTLRENLRQSKSRKNQYQDNYNNNNNDDDVNRGTPAYIETTTFRTSTPSPIKEYQQPAETSAFVSQRNRYNKQYNDQFNSYYNNNNNNNNNINRITVSSTTRKNIINQNTPQNILKPREQIPDFPHSTFNPIFKPRTTTTTTTEPTNTNNNYYYGNKNKEQKSTAIPYVTTQNYRKTHQDLRTVYPDFKQTAATTMVPVFTTDIIRNYQGTSTPGSTYTERAETTPSDFTEASTISLITPPQTYANSKTYNTFEKIQKYNEFSRLPLTTTTTTTLRPLLQESYVGQTAGNPTQPIVKYQNDKLINNNNYDQNSLGTTQSHDLINDEKINQVRQPSKSTVKINTNLRKNNIISTTEKPLKNYQHFNQQNINNTKNSKTYDTSITYKNGKIQQSTTTPYVPFTKNYAYITSSSSSTTTTTQKPPTYTATVPTFTGILQYKNGPKPIAKLQNSIPSTVSTFKGSPAYLPEVGTNQQLYLPKKSTPPNSSLEKEHALNMLKSLKGLEGTMPTIISNNANRDGLTIPHSSSPATLHSLALYFAQNSSEKINETDDLNQANQNDKLIQKNNTSAELPTNILTQHTINSYTELFNLNDAIDVLKNASSIDNNNNSESNDGEDDNDDNDDDDDLDIQQSEGPVAGLNRRTNNTKLRELAQVFTHALSAYLQDPETFKKILTEIRPTEPTFIDNNIDETTTFTAMTTEIYPTTSDDYPSVTKEKDEVLDFSEDFIGPRRNIGNPTTTEIPTTTDDGGFGYYTTSLTYSDVNLPAAAAVTTTQASIENTRDYLDPPSDDFASAINQAFDSSNGNEIQNLSGPSGNDADNYYQPDYLPDENNRVGKLLKNSTSYQPYGQYVKPDNSNPIHDNYVASSTPSSYEETFPPNHRREELTTEFIKTTTDIPTTTDLPRTTTVPFRIRYYDTTTIIPDKQDNDDDSESLVTANSIYSNYKNYNYASTQKYSLDKPNNNFITQVSSQSTNPINNNNNNINDKLTNEDIENRINNHWTSSPVTELWETNVFVDPNHINHELTSSNNNIKTTSVENISNDPTTHTSITTNFDNLVTDATNSINSRNSKQYINDNNYNINNNFESSTPLEWAATETDTPTSFSLLDNLNTATPSSPIYTTKSTTTITSSITTNNNKQSGALYSITKTINKKLNDNNNSTIENEMLQAKEMFGNLNDTSSATLMKIMKTADKDVTVRQLVLLLISHCSGPMNKTKEEEKNELLNELLKMPVSKFGDDESREIVADINRVNLSPIVIDDTQIKTTSISTTSTEPIVTTFRSSKQLKRIKTNVDDALINYNDSDDIVDDNVVSDARALELLRSLYTVAAKWG
ncbi:putative uncharacterized protein DDB_G0282133 [Aphidius gifuensis]|uniref:putative uncharacterized protein DDB_G0282133 n=1 Tax=Aphidius gifuensis TaxID=684658 RepID=UPI001CDCC1F3|nr:putative uncharacterized protein DDB_G0282133 [Aphidius gifuensis]